MPLVPTGSWTSPPRWGDEDAEEAMPVRELADAERAEYGKREGNEEAEGATPSKGPASAEDAREDDEGRKKKKEV